MPKRSLVIAGAVIAILLVLVIIILVVALAASGDNYGLEFEPNIPGEEGKVIMITHGDDENLSNYTDRLVEFLEPYENPSEEAEEHLVQCQRDQYPSEDQVCKINLELLGTECTRENEFGYRRGRPCVLLYPFVEEGWEPEYYNSTEDLPDEMPAVLQERISLVRNNPTQASAFEMKTLWVSCEGENITDHENIGPLRFYPGPGFAGFYFPPKRHLPGYLEPVIALQFQRPKSGTLISVKCSLWAKNIPDGWDDLHFHIQVD